MSARLADLDRLHAEQVKRLRALLTTRTKLVLSRIQTAEKQRDPDDAPWFVAIDGVGHGLRPTTTPVQLEGAPVRVIPQRLEDAL